MSLTTAQRRALQKQNITEVVLALLTLSHPVWDAPIYAVNNAEDVLHQGTTYTAFPFRVQLPNLDERRPSARLSIQNVSREIGRHARQVDSPIDVDIRLVMESDSETIVTQVPRLVLRGVTLDQEAVEGELTLDALAFEPAGLMSFNAGAFPGLFRSG